MIKQVMKIFYNGTCLPFKDKERTTHYPVAGGSFMGASNTTEVRFYIDRIGGESATWVCVSKLPNGKKGAKVMETLYDNELGENYAKLELSSFYTQAKGDLYLTLCGYQGGITYEQDEEDLYTILGTPTIEATGSVKLNIAYATLIDNGDEEETITLQQIMALVGTKLNMNSPMYIKVVDSISNINSATYEDYLQAGDLVYDKSSNKVYSLSVSSDTFVATLVEDLDSVGGFTPSSLSGTLTAEQLILANKEISFALYNGELYLRVSTSGGVHTFAQEWQIFDDTTYLTIGRYKFDVNATSGAISNVGVEEYAVYSKTQADNVFVNLSENQTISGKKTFTTLPQSSVVPSADNDLVNRKFITTNYYDKTTIDYMLVNIDDLANYYTKSQTDTLLNAKQDKLVSGTNIKTVANKSLVGGGNVDITKSDVGLGNLTNDLQVKASEKGVANGVATLDSNSKVPMAQLPDSILGQLLFGGTFNASSGVATLTTNAQAKLGTSSATITLTNDTSDITGYGANNGIFYVATESGTFASISFVVGDWLLSTGNAWAKVDNTDAVSSVNGKTGAVVLDKSDIGLGNVDNTSDLNKPISTATQNALNLKANASDIYTQAQTDTLLSAKQDKLPNVVNNRFLHTNNSGNYEWTGLINTISGTSVQLTSGEFDELVEEHIFAINNVSLPYLTNSTYELNYISIKLGSTTKQFLVSKNSATEYVGTFDILDDTYLYQINFFYDGTDIYLKSTTYNVIPNNALVDSNGYAIVDINGNYLIVS